MGLTFGFLTVDCTDPGSQARWWAGAVGGEIDYEMTGWVQVNAPGFPHLGFVIVPDGKVVKNRLHLDLGTDDRAAEVGRLERLGATSVAEHGAGEYRWTVLRDPEGNELCVYAHEPRPS